MTGSGGAGSAMGNKLPSAVPPPLFLLGVLDGRDMNSGTPVFFSPNSLPQAGERDLGSLRECDHIEGLLWR